MDLVELVDCADFAAKKHTDQRRKNAAATPYINHPIGNEKLYISTFIPSLKLQFSPIPSLMCSGSAPLQLQQHPQPPAAAPPGQRLAASPACMLHCTASCRRISFL